MKIAAILTEDETRFIPQNIEFKDINTIPHYNQEKDTFEKNGIEYPTEDEMYEAIEDMEL